MSRSHAVESDVEVSVANGISQGKSRTALNASAALVLSFVPTAQTWAGVEPSVTIGCTECYSYSDLQSKALSTAINLGVGGAVGGGIALPGQTSILISASKAPISYAFSYAATKHTIGTIGLTYYTYSVSPITKYAEASDLGAVKMDMLLYKALRVSGLPTVKLPSTDMGGAPITPSIEDVLLTSIVSAMMPVVGIPGVKTLPGLGNWSLLPSLTVIYNGKTYTLYNGDEVKIQFADGSTAILIVTVGGFGSSPGFFKVKPKEGGQSTAPAPAGNVPSVSIPTLDPASLTYTGIPVDIYSSGFLPLKYGIVISGPIKFIFDYYDIG
jgi:hypothetical protein